MSTYESVIFIAKEVLVYRIPPLKTSQGYRASEWDVDNPIWRGRLSVLEKGPEGAGSIVKCELRLEDPNTGELFACVPYLSTGKGVEQVTDSSRFFAIRVVDGQRHAYLGMGFLDRSESFDFNIALQDFKRHADPALPDPKSTDTKPDSKDYSLKEGETITISFGKAPRRRKLPTTHADTSSITSLPFLPPPPTAQDVKKGKNDPAL
ncbi:hypothetical protein V1512DRAFT_269550 [Lipomyces arxii]|uniref:uncharacterized protein n=1 Tax=Lipomyces arxii TaxID=56418 RepID=UPI0034CD5E5E